MEILAVEVVGVCVCMPPRLVPVFFWVLQVLYPWDTFSAFPFSLVFIRCCCSPKRDLIFSDAVSLQNQHYCRPLFSRFRTLGQFSPLGKKKRGKNHSRSPRILSSLPLRGVPKQPYNNKWKRCPQPVFSDPLVFEQVLWATLKKYKTSMQMGMG